MGNAFSTNTTIKLPENLVSQLKPDIKNILAKTDEKTKKKIIELNKIKNIQNIKLINKNRLKITYDDESYIFIGCFGDEYEEQCGYEKDVKPAKPAETEPAKAPATAMYKQSTVL